MSDKEIKILDEIKQIANAIEKRLENMKHLIEKAKRLNHERNKTKVEPND